MAMSNRDPFDPEDPDDSAEFAGRTGSALPSDLLAIREQLKRARAERGACPPWDELRADLLPGGASRPGRAERMAHFEICPYCETHVAEWKKSFDHASDTLGAIERGVARGILQGAKGLAGKIVTSATSSRSSRREEAGREEAAPTSETSDTNTNAPPPATRGPEWTPTYIVSHDLPARAPVYETPEPARAPVQSAPSSPSSPPPSRLRNEPPFASPPAAPPPAAPAAPAAPPAPAPPQPTYVARTIASPSGSMAPGGPVPSAASGPRAMPQPTGGLLVVECVRDRVPPDSLFLCAGALGLEVACVERIEELEDDPDLVDVQAIVIASDRSPDEWPQVVRRARRLVPGRIVLVLAMFGQEAPKGARRALGDALLPASVSAEELLVALDRTLR